MIYRNFDSIQSFTKTASRIAQFAIRPVADINEANLIRFAVATTKQRLVAILEPMATDNQWMPQAAFRKTLKTAGALRLVINRR